MSEHHEVDHGGSPLQQRAGNDKQTGTGGDRFYGKVRDGRCANVKTPQPKGWGALAQAEPAWPATVLD
ncbi:hypothetical protein DYL61_16695 [Pseudomonas nabeulensis]|uniref:Uncharacterized protein n=1 Tax=Pseudomonas nabeulensis TaxID=2293833 RepID=A0A4Z0B1M9_9PSED|nr:hypothetical protein DYL61_16695 [Pseudomonas nabeulensis]